MRSFLAVLFTLSVPGQPALAADSTQALAERFVVLLRYEEQFVKYQEQCVATQRSVSPEALAARNPTYFGGIQPGHGKWPAVTAAYGRYFQEACSRPTKTEFLQVLSSTYAQALTPKQLQQSIKFYSSDTGRSLISAHRQATGAVYEAWTATNSRYLADLTAKFQREIAALVAAK